MLRVNYRNEKLGEGRGGDFVDHPASQTWGNVSTSLIHFNTYSKFSYELTIVLQTNFRLLKSFNDVRGKQEVCDYWFKRMGGDEKLDRKVFVRDKRESMVFCFDFGCWKKHYTVSGGVE